MTWPKSVRDRMISIVLHTTNDATTSAIRSPYGVASSLGGNDLLLETRQQQLPFGQGQPQTGDIDEIIRPVNLHDVDGLFLTVSPGSHQPQNPTHASTPREKRRENTSSAPAPPISRQFP